MAFMIYSTDDGRIPAWEYHKVTPGSNLKVGKILSYGDGGLLTAGSKFDFICMRDVQSVGEDEIIPVVPITAGLVLEAPVSNGSAQIGYGILPGNGNIAAEPASSGGHGKIVAIPEEGYVRVRF